MEGDLIGLEVELFPDGGSFPAAPPLFACNAPLQQPLAERTCDNIIPSGELAVKARDGRKQPVTGELKKPRTSPAD
eukprot:2705522-Pleurochrysis_carterae.AAC.1